MNRIRKEVSGKTTSALEIRFESQSLTSHAGLVVFQRLFSRLELKERLRGCFRHESGRRAYGPHTVTLLLVVHLLLGCRELRDMGRYRNDEAVRRATGLRRLPDVSTVSRTPSRRTTAKRSPLWTFAPAANDAQRLPAARRAVPQPRRKTRAFHHERRQGGSRHVRIPCRFCNIVRRKTCNNRVDVAAEKVGKPECRQWCEDALRVSFNDSDVEVRKVAASCFRHIHESDLATYENLIEAFCNSPAYEDDAFFLLDTLKNARAQLPGMTTLGVRKALGQRRRSRTGCRGCELSCVPPIPATPRRQMDGTSFGSDRPSLFGGAGQRRGWLSRLRPLVGAAGPRRGMEAE